MQIGVQLFLIIVGSLVAVAWATLLERKILAGFQVRKGPNKIRLKGAAQPLGDAVKLLLKAAPAPAAAGGVFWGAPVFRLGITLAMWGIFPGGASTTLACLVFLCLSSVHVLGILGAGWGSNRVFGLLGASRAISLVLSYEIPLVVLLLALWVLRQELSLGWGPDEHILGASLLALAGWILCLMVAETHRAPFDFVEAESELVSGFNVEYGSWGFVLLFLAEYGALLFVGEFIVLMLCPLEGALGPLLGVGVAASVLCARAAYPRLKIQHMMEACWAGAVPVSLVGFLFVVAAGS